MVFAVLLLLSSTKNRKKYRVLFNFSTTVSYVILCTILAHSTEGFFTGERGLEGTDLLYE